MLFETIAVVGIFIFVLYVIEWKTKAKKWDYLQKQEAIKAYLKIERRRGTNNYTRLIFLGCMKELEDRSQHKAFQGTNSVVRFFMTFVSLYASDGTLRRFEQGVVYAHLRELEEELNIPESERTPLPWWCDSIRELPSVD